MSVHFLPVVLNEKDVKLVKALLDKHPPQLEGGYVQSKLNKYEHLGINGKVLETKQFATIKDAAVYFLTSRKTRRGPNSSFVVPLAVRDAAVQAVQTGLFCTCSTAECINSGCDKTGFISARRYVKQYAAKASNPNPTPIRVRDHEFKVTTFTPTLQMLPNPSPDDVRDGVLAKMIFVMS